MAVCGIVQMQRRTTASTLRALPTAGRPFRLHQIGRPPLLLPAPRPVRCPAFSMACFRKRWICASSCAGSAGGVIFFKFGITRRRMKSILKRKTGF